eukprot:g2611.t1
MDGRIDRKKRPIHYNTWEAVYFDHDHETLFNLANKAAEVGAERFILDDGWFGSRRNDKAGLGDWWPSKDVYPDGLGPLIKHVTDLGMEFGLWFEPEMVNPDSELYREHPDWILHAEGVEQVPFRSQFVLDLTRPEVSDYLFDHMHKLLSEHEISYVKWDMNRDVHHPGSRGRPAIHQQTRALYALIERLREAHPDLEIESCSSGGARADYGILRRTDRIWTSDSNDALDRQRIQRGASHFFPLEIMGAHVGPETCHITGRRLSMEMRVATALFGHMGMELNLLEEAPANLEVLKAGLALHKQHRDLIHSGDFHRLDTPDHVNAIGVVAKDRSEALFSWQKQILELIRSQGYVATDQLVRQFGVTPQTIRRDINTLCELELIERFHGGAGRIGNAYNQPYQDRLQEGMDGKRKIARMVANRIPDGASLFLNIGTTTEALAAELVGRTDLRIVTNNINIANMMRETDGSDVMIAGGFVRQSDGGIVGEATTEFLKQFRLDIGVIGISGIDEDGSLLDFDYQEIRSAQAIIQNSRTVYLVADHAKFGRRAMIRLGQYSDIDHLFTDKAPPEEFMDAIRESDMELHVADEQ